MYMQSCLCEFAPSPSNHRLTFSAVLLDVLELSELLLESGLEEKIWDCVVHVAGCWHFEAVVPKNIL